MLAQIKARGLVARTMFGSDGPKFSGTIRRYSGEILDAMEIAGFSPADVAAIMAGNFAALIGQP